MELAKLFCPVPNENDPYWKKVLQIRVDIAYLNSKIEALMETDEETADTKEEEALRNQTVPPVPLRGASFELFVWNTAAAAAATAGCRENSQQAVGGYVEPSTESRWDRIGRTNVEIASKNGHHENEVPPLEKWSIGDMLAIDSMACPKQKIVIEFDDPSHYLKEVGTSDVTRGENGATKVKRRILKRVGWKVITLNYQDWIEANGAESKGRLWLKEILLSNAGIK
eukprot:scaffold229571_cov46-Attheya_sp.AAC.4